MKAVVMPPYWYFEANLAEELISVEALFVAPTR